MGMGMGMGMERDPELPRAALEEPFHILFHPETSSKA
jgi:hypothetical protein